MRLDGSPLLVIIGKPSMQTASRILIPSSVIVGLACLPAVTQSNPPVANTLEGPPVLWRDPTNIGSRDLYFGPGGKRHQPVGPFYFEKEVTTGSQPKFDVIDAAGVRWNVKLGLEAQPETAASRLLWAAGYFSNEDYYLPTFEVRDLPHLHRGSSHVTSDGLVHGARLKRRPKDEVKIGPWKWAECPFFGTREWYGLRVMMALMNNWDVKDQNNVIYQVKGDHPEQRYLVSDLGASFGPVSLSRSLKGHFEAYRESRWIRSVSQDYVDFNVPSPPTGAYWIALPLRVERVGLDWFGRHIPREDCRWIGNLLSHLSLSQIQDAFRAADYSPGEIQGFSAIVEQRIRELQTM
jgi:hypothetical protein